MSSVGHLAIGKEIPSMRRITLTDQLYTSSQPYLTTLQHLCHLEGKSPTLYVITTLVTRKSEAIGQSPSKTASTRTHDSPRAYRRKYTTQLAQW
eukprot:gene11563-21797_t